LLVGYQGKLLKLAGGIFNTSSHLADARLEILSGAMLRVGCSAAQALAVLELATTDAAQPLLEKWGCLQSVYEWLAQAISQRSQAYVAKYADVELPIGSVLFDRQGRILHHRDP
jgi:cobalt-precorrin-5B (C1)-methyltransferase